MYFRKIKMYSFDGLVLDGGEGGGRFM